MSVLHQSMGEFELIVVDDGSTDGTRDVVPDDPRVTVVTQENGGEAAARDAGLAAATRAWGAVLDADDAWEPHHLPELESIRRKGPEAPPAATPPTEPSPPRPRRGGGGGGSDFRP